MSKTEVFVPDIGTIHVTRKKGQRTMRLRVNTKGQVQVSMPWMVPRATALDFVLAKKNWIKKQQSDVKVTFYDGMLLGKTLRLKLVERSKVTRAKHEDRTVSVHFDMT